MESNVLEKSANNSIAFDDSSDCQNLWCCGSISPKTVLIFPKNFLNKAANEELPINKYMSKLLNLIASNFFTYLIKCVKEIIQT